MLRIRELCRRLKVLFRAERFDRDLHEEMQFHLEMQAEENQVAGMDPQEAHYAARRQFGNVTLVKETSRATWGWNWIETLLQDLRYALRTMGRSPGFATVALLSLALGIGANTAVFSVFDAVLLRSLPIRDPGELVFVERVDRRESVSRFSYPAYRELREKCRSFAGMLAFGTVHTVTVRTAETASAAEGEGARAQLVSGDFFQVLGVPALIGRTLRPEDDRIPGAHPVAVISHGYWKRRWAQDPDALGQTLTANGVSFTIVGVTPKEFFGVVVGNTPDIWMPTMMQSQIRYRSNFWSADEARPELPWPDQPDIAWLTVMGRVPQEVASKSAAEASVLFHRLESARGRETPELRIRLTPGSRGISDLRRRFSEPLQILMGMVSVVLLIACANVANLLLARAAARRHEIAMRLAIGAGQLRLVRQLLTESMLMALLGGALGLVFAAWGQQSLLALVSLDPGVLPLGLSSDVRVLAFTAAVSLATGLLFGLAPALQATSQAVGVSTARHSRVSISRMLVVAQVTLSTMLLIGAGLFARTLHNLETFDTGYRGEDLLLVEINPRVLSYEDAQLQDLYERLIDRIKTIPAVQSASLSLSPPIGGGQWISNVSVAGYSPAPDVELDVHKILVTPEYFETVGLTFIEGRGFTARDSGGSPPVAVINQTMARYVFGSRSAIGQRFVFGNPFVGDGIEIVGVVSDAVYNRVRDRIPNMAYLPVAQQGEGHAFHGTLALHDLEVRTAAEAAPRVAPLLRRAISDVDPKLPIMGVWTLRERIERSVRQERSIARLSGFFGALALALAAVGLYGVMSYAVVRRTSEIGIRMALGAAGRDVRRLILRETLVLASVGIGLGVLAALLSLRVASNQLFGVSPHDPTTMFAAALIMMVVGAFSGYLPARRASRVDPLVALRYE